MSRLMMKHQSILGVAVDKLSIQTSPAFARLLVVHMSRYRYVRGVRIYKSVLEVFAGSRGSSLDGGCASAFLSRNTCLELKFWKYISENKIVEYSKTRPPTWRNYCVQHLYLKLTPQLQTLDPSLLAHERNIRVCLPDTRPYVQNVHYVGERHASLCFLFYLHFFCRVFIRVHFFCAWAIIQNSWSASTSFVSNVSLHYTWWNAWPRVTMYCYNWRKAGKERVILCLASHKIRLIESTRIDLRPRYFDSLLILQETKPFTALELTIKAIGEF